MNNVAVLIKEGSIVGLPVTVTVASWLGEILYTSLPGRIQLNGHSLMGTKADRLKLNSCIIKISVSNETVDVEFKNTPLQS
jgi:hypothetical protein